MPKDTDDALLNFRVLSLALTAGRCGFSDHGGNLILGQASGIKTVARGPLMKMIFKIILFIVRGRLSARPITAETGTGNFIPPV